jgi:hypothetical protein
MTTTEPYEECFLYVDGKDVKQVTAVLAGLLSPALPSDRWEVDGFEVDVSRNGLRRADQPDTAEGWPVIVEVEAIGPADADVVAFVAGVMIYLRSRGHRVAAACDYADQLPR